MNLVFHLIPNMFSRVEAKAQCRPLNSSTMSLQTLCENRFGLLVQVLENLNAKTYKFYSIQILYICIISTSCQQYGEDPHMSVMNVSKYL